MDDIVLPGFSGARVIRHGKIVEKTSSSAFDELAWYKKAERFRFKQIPWIHGLIHDNSDGTDTLGMDYIENVPLHTVDIDEFVMQLEESVSKLKRIPCFIEPSEIETVTERIDRHVSLNPALFDSKIISRLEERLTSYPLRNTIDEERGFSHGDLSIDNVLWNPERGIVLIDPIYNLYLYSSWMADVAKLCASIDIGVATNKWERPEHYRTIKEKLLEMYAPYKEAILLLMLYQTIRVIRYRERAEERAAIAAIVMKGEGL